MSYPVLITVSGGYPKVKGRLLTCYSPVRRSSTPEGAFPLDLHVLSTPPAFVLSQDQTLREQVAKSASTATKGGFNGRSLTMKESLWPGQAPTRSQRSTHPSRTARGRPRRTADRFPLPAETGADEPDVDRPQPPVGAGPIAKLLSFQRPRALRARPRSLANRLAKHKSGASPRGEEVRAQPQQLGHALERPGRVEHHRAGLRRGEPILEICQGKGNPLHADQVDK